MSEFLDRLVTRSTDSAGVLHPRPAVVFEAPEPQDTALASGNATVVRQAAPSEVAAPYGVQPSKSLVQQPMHEEVAEPPLIQPQSSLAASGDDRCDDAPHSLSASSESPTPPNRSRSDGPVPPPMRADVPARTRLDSRRPGSIFTRDTSPKVLPRDKPAAIPPARVFTGKQTVRAATNSEPLQGDEHHARACPPRAATTESADVPRVMRVPPREDTSIMANVAPVSRRTFRERAASGIPAPASPPTVHVTIGRVEVRASTRVEPTRSRHQPAILSLDEYLKQQPRAR